MTIGQGGRRAIVARSSDGNTQVRNRDDLLMGGGADYLINGYRFGQRPA